MKQVELIKVDPKPHVTEQEIYYNYDMSNPECHRVCWIDEHVEKGWIISLKGDDINKWVVKKVWNIEKEKIEINRTWHVGGL